MNIFVTDENPAKAAMNLCDKHISKMIVESAQMLSTAHWVLDGGHSGAIYKATHANHPCSVWVRESSGNYGWLWRHAMAMCYEYTLRYKRVHKTEQIIWRLLNPPSNLPNKERTPFAICFFARDPVAHLMCYVPGDTIQSYRNFYKLDKIRFAKWNHSEKPSWW